MYSGAVAAFESALDWSTAMKEPRQRWERPNFEEHPLGAEVTAYLTSSTPDRK